MSLLGKIPLTMPPQRHHLLIRRRLNTWFIDFIYNSGSLVVNIIFLILFLYCVLYWNYFYSFYFVYKKATINKWVYVTWSHYCHNNVTTYMLLNIEVWRRPITIILTIGNKVTQLMAMNRFVEPNKILDINSWSLVHGWATEAIANTIYQFAIHRRRYYM